MNNSTFDSKSNIKFHGSMPAPRKNHGEELLGGVIIGRSWRNNGWEYMIHHSNGNILYYWEE